MGKKKAFIDKKKAVTYNLVYRDPTDDPEDEDGGQGTLAPIGGHRGGAHPIPDDYPEYYDDEGSVYDSEYSLAMSRSAAAHHDSSYSLSEERRRELLALGFPDDGYDYLKHLRDLGRGRAPAGKAGGVATIPEDQELDGFDDDEDGADGGGDGEWQEGSDSEEDFTIYDQEPAQNPNAAAAAARRKAAAGACEISDFADVLDEFLSEHRATESLEAEGLKQLQVSDDVALLASRPDPEALAATRARLQRQVEAAAAAAAAAGAAGAGDDEPPAAMRTIVVQEAERWDCESVLSLTSNLENHPGKIVEPQRRTGGRGGGLIRLSAKTGMPVTRGSVRDGGGGGGAVLAAGGTIPEEGEQEGEEGEEEGGEDSESEEGGSVLDPAMLSRRKGETAEERKARKAAVKEARRNQRTAKKEMKNMFRQQATRAQKQSAGRSQAAGSTYVIP